MSIQQNPKYDDSNRLSDVLQLWIDSNKDVTWKKIISVIADPPVNNKRLANEIEQSVLIQEHEYTDKSTLDQHPAPNTGNTTFNIIILIILH